MAIRQLRLIGDEILAKTSREVSEINERILELLDDMAQTMYEKNGVGLAAVQVGILRRLVVIDVGGVHENSECEKESCEGCEEQESCEEYKQYQKELELEALPPEERAKKSETLIKLINPEVICSEGEVKEEEACLSVPGMVGEVCRPEKVKVRALDTDGNEVIYEAEGFLKKALCHEIDHLNGILFTDIAENVTDINKQSEDDKAEE